MMGEITKKAYQAVSSEAAQKIITEAGKELIKYILVGAGKWAIDNPKKISDFISKSARYVLDCISRAWEWIKAKCKDFYNWITGSGHSQEVKLLGLAIQEEATKQLYDNVSSGLKAKQSSEQSCCDFLMYPVKQIPIVSLFFQKDKYSKALAEVNTARNTCLREIEQNRNLIHFSGLRLRTA